MEVRGRQPGGADEAQQRYREAQLELARANREHVRRAREVLQSLSTRRLERRRLESRAAAEEIREPQDQIELSTAARAAASRPDEGRDARVRELAGAHAEGRLNTPDRVERAAQRLLGG
ncbi:MAG: hypothetical protein AB1726_11345 [Planctomycetota bacterium]